MKINEFGPLQLSLSQQYIALREQSIYFSAVADSSHFSHLFVLSYSLLLLLLFVCIFFFSTTNTQSFNGC